MTLAAARIGSPAWRFWIANTLIWTAYAAVSLAMGRTFAAGLSSGFVLISLVLSIGLLLASGALRGWALERDWMQLDLGPLAVRLVGAVAVLAALVQVLAALVQVLIAVALSVSLHRGWVQLPGGGTGYSPGTAFGYWANTAIVLGLWTGGWAGRHAIRRARASELAALRAESQRHALELDALRARLNPHFIFNALNNLRALILEDPERARELVTRLSGTLRHALEHSGQEWTTLQQELQVVDDYLAVEAVHYEERLQVHRDIDAAALDARLPPMTVQLLVENAIKHGIACTPGGGALTLRITRAEGALHVEVTNPLPSAATPLGTGVGHSFLTHRLDRCGGRFEFGPCDGRFRARMEIPQ